MIDKVVGWVAQTTAFSLEMELSEVNKCISKFIDIWAQDKLLLGHVGGLRLILVNNYILTQKMPFLFETHLVLFSCQSF